MEPAPAVRPAATPEADKQAELRDRLAVSVLLLPFVFLLVQLGGWLYVIAVLAILLFAAVEFGGLFIVMHQRPAVPLLVAGVALVVASEQFPGLNPGGVLPVLIVLAALAWPKPAFAAPYRFKQGAFEITVVSDGHLELPVSFIAP